MLTVSQGPTHHFFALENILVTYYVQVPSVDALRDRDAWMQTITRTHDRVALVVVVDKDAVGPLPEEEFRAVLHEQAERYKHLTACSAVVLEGNSSRFSLLRAGLRSLTLASHVSFPVRYFDTISEAAPFAVACVDAMVDSRAIVEALESVRLQPPVQG